MKGRISFLGTGTSSGVPVLGCDCAVCRSKDPRDNRLRSSALFSFDNGAEILLDCGTDFRYQALRQNIRRLDGILFTHSHQDHIGGIDELRQLNFIMGRDIDVYGNALSLEEIKNRFDYIFKKTQEGGGKPRINLKEHSGPFLLSGIPVVPLEVMHGALSINGYRMGSAAYITDASYLPPATSTALQGLEVLVINALRHKAHPTHFNLEQALEISALLKPRRTFFIHLTHDFLYSRDNPLLPPGVEFACDGQSVDFEF